MQRRFVDEATLPKLAKSKVLIVHRDALLDVPPELQIALLAVVDPERLFDVHLGVEEALLLEEDDCEVEVGLVELAVVLYRSLVVVDGLVQHVYAVVGIRDVFVDPVVVAVLGQLLQQFYGFGVAAEVVEGS